MTPVPFADRIGRFETIQTIHLQHGQHKPNDTFAMCAMEAAAYVAGEPWSDHPKCVCPVLAAFARAWNDSLPDDTRDVILKPFVLRLIDTKSSKQVEQRRGYMAINWLIKVYTPKWLDLVPSLSGHSLALRNLENIADMAGAVAAGERVSAAYSAAYSAASSAAPSAANSAAN